MNKLGLDKSGLISEGPALTEENDHKSYRNKIQEEPENEENSKEE